MDTPQPGTHGHATSYLIHNERIKLLATTLNAVAAIVLLAGLLVPTAMSLFGLPPMAGPAV